MAFELDLSVRFQTLFEQLNQTIDLLKQVQSTSQQVKVQMESDFRKGAQGNQQMNNQVRQTGAILGQLNQSLSQLGGSIGVPFVEGGKSAQGFNITVASSLEAVNALADAAIRDSSVFKDKSDEKQAALQQEVKILKELQAAAAKYASLQNNAKIFTREITNQTEKVKTLTSELQRIALPEQQTDPFQKATTGVISLRTQILQARNEADQAATTYGEWSPQFAAAAQKLAVLQQRLVQINKTALAFSPEARLAGITTVLRGVVGGFTGLQGLLAFIGQTGDDVARSLQKIQGLLLFTQGFNEILSLRTGLNALALQLGLTKPAFEGAAKAQQEFVDSSLKDTASLGSDAASITKFTTGAGTAKEVIDKLKVSKESDAAASVKQTVSTEASVAAQSEDAIATAANARAKSLLTGASNLVTGAEVKVAAGATAAAGAQELNTVITETSGVAAAGAASAFRALWAVMIANPITAIAALVVSLAGAYIFLSKETDDALEKQQRLNRQQKENFKILQELDNAFTQSSRDRIAQSEKELALSRAREDAPVVILEKELELANKKRDLTRKSIADLDLTKDRIGELQAQYESAIETLGSLKNSLSFDTGNEDLKKRVEAQEGVVENLKEQLDKGQSLWKDYNDSVTEQAVKTAQIMKTINESIFSSLKFEAEARVNLAKVGTDERVKAELALAEVEIKTQQEVLKNKIQSINDEIKLRKEKGITISRDEAIAEINAKGALSSEIEKLETELQIRLKTIKTNAAILRINEEKASDQAHLVEVQKNSEQEIDLKLKIIAETAKAEALSLDKTAKEKIAILLQAENEQQQLREEFFRKQIKDSIDIERTAVATELAIVQEGSIQELRLKKQLVDDEKRLAIANAIDTISNEILLAARIKEILTKAAKDKTQLDKDFQKARIERARDAALQISELEKIKLQGVQNNPFATESENIKANEQILNLETANLKARLDALNLMHKQGLISENEYKDQLKQIQKEEAQNFADVENQKSAALKNSMKEIISFVKAAFPDLSSTMHAAFEQLGNDIGKIIDDFRRGTVNFRDGIATVNSLVQLTTELTKAHISAAEESINLQIQDNESFISNIDSQISSKVDQINQETQLNAQNVANNLKLRQDELTILNKQKQDALNQDKKLKNEKVKLEKEKASIEAVSQASALLLAAANILASFSTLPFGVGIAIAAGVIAGMYGIFASFKQKVSAATQGTVLEHGGTVDIKGRKNSGIVKGKRHTQGGHQIEGTDIFVEDGEFVTNRNSSAKFFPLLMGANKNDFSHITWRDILSLPGIKFPESMQMKAPRPISINNKSIEKISGSKSELRVLEIHHAHSLSNRKMEAKAEALYKELVDFKKRFTERPERHVLPAKGQFKIMTLEGSKKIIITHGKPDS